MIGIDTNILVYAHRRDSPDHAKARATLEDLLSGAESVAMCWSVVNEFIGIVTRRQIFPNATPIALAFEQVHDWLSSHRVVMLQETSDYFGLLEQLSVDGRVAGPVIHDARVAAIYLTHGVREVWSADRDFTRFPSLRVVNPLIG